MKTVILDGYTANPGDLSWDGLKELGELQVYDRTSPEELLRRAEEAEVLLTMLNAEQTYYAAVDAFGEGGVTEGECLPLQ